MILGDIKSVFKWIANCLANFKEFLINFSEWNRTCLLINFNAMLIIDRIEIEESWILNNNPNKKLNRGLYIIFLFNQFVQGFKY